MLVLTRLPANREPDKSSIKIGDDVTVTILRVEGQQVKIGIAAPKDKDIVRTELLGDLDD